MCCWKLSEVIYPIISHKTFGNNFLVINGLNAVSKYLRRLVYAYVDCSTVRTPPHWPVYSLTSTSLSIIWHLLPCLFFAEISIAKGVIILVTLQMTPTDGCDLALENQTSSNYLALRQSLLIQVSLGWGQHSAKISL